MTDQDSEPVGKQGNRRDFLYIGTGVFAGVGAALSLWPFIDSMNPSADVLALSSLSLIHI